MPEIMLTIKANKNADKILIINIVDLILLDNSKQKEKIQGNNSLEKNNLNNTQFKKTVTVRT